MSRCMYTKIFCNWFLMNVLLVSVIRIMCNCHGRIAQEEKSQLSVIATKIYTRRKIAIVRNCDDNIHKTENRYSHVIISKFENIKNLIADYILTFYNKFSSHGHYIHDISISINPIRCIWCHTIVTQSVNKLENIRYFFLWQAMNKRNKIEYQFIIIQQWYTIQYFNLENQ